MSKEQNTPGPYAYDRDSGEIYYDDGDVRPTIAFINLEGVGEEQAIADGELLAAAPDLLAALIALMPSNLGALPETMPDRAKLSLEVSFGELRKARAAIAKAQGR